MIYPEHNYDRLALILMKIRGKVSRGKMAKAIGVSSSTINNWETARSAPTFNQILRMASVNSSSPLKYCCDYLYPEVFWGISSATDINVITKALKIMCHSMSDREKLIVAYGLKDEQMDLLRYIVADLHTPIGDKQSVALAISTAYTIAEETGTLVQTGLSPDMRSFEKAINRGRVAFRSFSDGYFVYAGNNEKYTSRIQSMIKDVIGDNAGIISRNLRISQKTIESWRDGVTSPDFNELCALFDYADLNIFQSFRSIFHPGASDHIDCPGIDEILDQGIDRMSEQNKRYFFYVIRGEHNSLIYPFLQLMAELFALPDVSKRLIMIMIENNYHNAVARKCLTCPSEILPDLGGNAYGD